MLWAHMSEAPPPVSALRPDLPPAVDEVLTKAMAKAPEERYPTCTDFADAVRAALGLSTYTTPSSAYDGNGTGLPPSRGTDLAGPASAALPVPPSPVAVPPPAPDPVSPPREEEAAPSFPTPEHSVTQSGSSVGFADTTGQVIPQPSRSPTAESSSRQAVNPTRRRRMLAATVVVVAAGGVTAAVLALSSHGNPLLATLAEPDGATPTVMAFESDGTLVTADSARAYSWDIATRTPTQVDYESTAFGVTSMTGASGIISTEHITADSPGNVLQVWNSATGRVMATLAAPRGTVVNVAVLSPDGTEVAAADSDGLTYIWKIAG